ncbi:MAG TPA: molecular chaperone TorD family protein [Usitatibacter sp.]|jgi:TorA maturation chaperone TorD|nr:molecular chaperone TorD family protein [Usitatibacter sp.]
MDAVASPVVLQRALPAEEAARADFYALLARLFHGAPDAALLASLADAPALSGASALDAAWESLRQASRAMDAEAAREEYETLFIGVGKAQVSIYAGYYAGAPAADHPRIRLQRDLAELGLAHKPGLPEPEDHIAALLDVMRVLAAGGAGRAPAPLAMQRRFFDAHVAPAARGFFAAVQAAGQANYYRRVAQFAAAFLELEAQSFELD